MTRTNDSKLQLLAKIHLPGVVLTSAWLKKHRISSKLAWWYVKSGWLERIAKGAYKRAGDNVTWIGALSGLQYQLNLPLYVGGKTALQMLGRSHYIPVAGIKRVVLYGNKNFTIPRWFRKTDWQVDLNVRTTNLFTSNNIEIGILEREFGGILLKISSPERAIMEFLYHMPKYNTFDETCLLVENLAQLRPKVVQKLLQNCSSVKTKRLLLYFAEKYNHPWFEGLDLSYVDLGSGKIKISTGGKYISKYKISIPETTNYEYEI